MKHLFCFLISIMLLSILFSCKKDEPETINTKTTPIFYNYTQLEVGNYWIYQRYIVDSSGNATATELYDSCYIEKDTAINNKTYFKYVRPNYPGDPGSTFVRDSSNYLVNHDGKILFSSDNFTDILNDYYIIVSNNDTVCRVQEYMTDKDLVIETPAGQFTTSSFRSSYNLYPNYSPFGSHRETNTRYSLNVGIVSEILPFFIGNPNYTERRLVRFNVD
jgi:hypothetical protein